jgi:peptidoglycan/LPS O-acetylase OafA/YrhL
MAATATTAAVQAGVADAIYPSVVAAKLGELPSLTGLRFFAAFFVLCGHAAPALIKFSPDLVLPRNIAMSLTGIGMTLFFVLSGFVIHYNYADVGRAPFSRNLAKFYIARFARLYPLLAFLFLLEVGLRWQATDWPAVPFYLGLVQSWVYVLFDGRSLLSHFTVAQVTWSISTEWFFYCGYPVVAWLLAISPRRLTAALVLAAVCFLDMALCVAAYWHEQQINAFAQSVWGLPAVGGDGNNIFFIWLLSFSPVARIQEFLLGVATAHVFISTYSKPVSRLESRIGGAVLITAFVVLIVMCGSQSLPAMGPFSRSVNSVGVFVYPITIAAILFCCARYRSVASRGLSANWIVVCGDASYSIYMLHLIVIRSVEVSAVLPLTWAHILYVVVRFVLCALITIVFSIALHRFYEAPARGAVRGFLGRLTAPGSRGVDHWLVVTMAIGIPVALTAVGWYISLR